MNAMPGNGDGLPKARPCPMCGKPASRDFHPFCSERCKDRDLNQWLSGGYAIPAVEDDEDPDPERSQ